MTRTLKMSGLSMRLLIVAFLCGGCGSKQNDGGGSLDQNPSDGEEQDDSGQELPDSDVNTSDESETDSTDRNEDGSDIVESDTTVAPLPSRITIDYKEGNAAGGPIAYVMWLENSTRTFVQNLFVCNSLLNGSLTGTALPYWQLNKRKNSQVDGVSGATQHPSITVTRDISPKATNKFSVFVELDHSWDGNDWFGDQPAVLYAANIDLTNPRTQYDLVPLGWTKASQNSYKNVSGAPSSEDGELNTEVRYITNLAEDGGFGGEDSRTATNMVGSLTVTLH